MDANRLPFWPYILDKLPILVDGLLFSLKLFFIVVIISFFLAIIFGIAKVAGPKWLRAVLSFYTWLFRGTPIVLQLYIIYYGFPNLGIILDDWLCAVIIFVLSVTAYETEIIRGGLSSIDKGQFEACKVLGMNFPQTMMRVIIPQTIRKVLPTTCSEAIILFKDTSLVMSITLFDLMRRAQQLVTVELRIEPYMVAMVFYLIVSSILVFVFGKLEKRYSVGFD